MKQMLQEFGTGDKDSAAWADKLQALHRSVQHHVKEEEGAIFQKAQRVVDAAQANELMRRIEREKIAELQGATS